MIKLGQAAKTIYGPHLRAALDSDGGVRLVRQRVHADRQGALGSEDSRDLPLVFRRRLADQASVVDQSVLRRIVLFLEEHGFITFFLFFFGGGFVRRCQTIGR